jgi:hypothetical protein
MAFINTLYNLWPNGDEKIPGLRDGIAATADAVFSKYGISTPLLTAHVMAQISHECGAGHDVVENLNYTAGRRCRCGRRAFRPWRWRHPTPAIRGRSPTRSTTAAWAMRPAPTMAGIFAAEVLRRPRGAKARRGWPKPPGSISSAIPTWSTIRSVFSNAAWRILFFAAVCRSPGPTTS